MSCFEIFAHGKSFDPDAYLASTALAFDRKWHKGQYGSNHPLSSGVGLRLGDGSVLALDEQERIAGEFLAANREALRHLANYPGVEAFILGLELHTEVNGSISAMSFGVSPSLMGHSLEIGVKLVFYLQFDHQRRWEAQDAPAPNLPPITPAGHLGLLKQGDKGVRNQLRVPSARGRLRGMGRPLRAAPGGYVYHVLNRANARLTIFEGRQRCQEPIAAA